MFLYHKHLAFPVLRTISCKSKTSNDLASLRARAGSSIFGVQFEVTPRESGRRERRTGGGRALHEGAHRDRQQAPQLPSGFGRAGENPTRPGRERSPPRGRGRPGSETAGRRRPRKLCPCCGGVNGGAPPGGASKGAVSATVTARRCGQGRMGADSDGDCCTGAHWSHHTAARADTPAGGSGNDARNGRTAGGGSVPGSTGTARRRLPHRHNSLPQQQRLSPDGASRRAIPVRLRAAALQ